MAIFIRALELDDKARGLARAIEAIRAGIADATVFRVANESFGLVPTAPFAYWVKDRVRRLYQTLPPFQAEGRVAQQGASTKDDFRFLRCFWEISAENRTQSEAQKWVPFSKGGEFAPYYADVYLVINWHRDAAELEAALLKKYPYLGENANWVLHRECNYFHPGITWSGRSQRGISVRALPAGCIFADIGPAAFLDNDDERGLLALLAVTNSESFGYLVEMQAAFGRYQIGLVQRTPVPTLSSAESKNLASLAEAAWGIRYEAARSITTSPFFSRPALVSLARGDLHAHTSAYDSWASSLNARAKDRQAEIERAALKVYGLSKEDLNSASIVLDETVRTVTDEDSEAEIEGPLRIPSARQALDDLAGWFLGLAFGRFDIRLRGLEPARLRPFTSIPNVPPGMLVGKDGLPERHVPDDYPLAWPEDGLLVDSGGIPAARDIVRAVKRVIDVVWSDEGSVVEEQFCKLVNGRELRDYFREPSAFFDAHLTLYSRGKRKAPIYWPLSTASVGYTVWIYYPRLTADTLYKVVNECVVPEIARIEGRIAQLQGESANQNGREGARTTKELSQLAEHLSEMRDMREEIVRVARLSYQPDLNDGVEITAAPLWRLFRLPRWRTELEKTWRALEKGEYDWAHLAYAIWPERVKEKCKADKSLAIAHGLESLYEEPQSEEAGAKKKSRKRRGGR